LREVSNAKTQRGEDAKESKLCGSAVLAAFALKKDMKIYIAGKISGLVYEDALRTFAEAALEIERCGHEAVNPMAENGLDGDGKQYEWVEYMEKDIPLLLSCDAIYLLPNWKQSNGARIEKVIAEHSKMLIVTHGFPGNRGEIFATCRECGSVLDRDDDGVYHCGGCRHRLKNISPANNANGRESEEVSNAEAAKDAEVYRCRKCGLSLDAHDRFIGSFWCYFCRNSINSDSGVGIQSPARA
jgi:ribosomal protein L37AE/L43A